MAQESFALHFTYAIMLSFAKFITLAVLVVFSFAARPLVGRKWIPFVSAILMMVDHYSFASQAGLHAPVLESSKIRRSMSPAARSISLPYHVKPQLPSVVASPIISQLRKMSVVKYVSWHHFIIHYTSFLTRSIPPQAIPPVIRMLAASHRPPKTVIRSRMRS